MFFPTIQKVNLWSSILGIWFTVGEITSKTENKDEVLLKFEKHEIQIICCTTILERGITFEGIDVIVVDCDHQVFTASSLIQIMGRVARGVKDTSGEGVFISKRKCLKIRECIEYIDSNNVNAFGVKKI